MVIISDHVIVTYVQWKWFDCSVSEWMLFFPPIIAQSQEDVNIFKLIIFAV